MHRRTSDTSKRLSNLIVITSKLFSLYYSLIRNPPRDQDIINFQDIHKSSAVNVILLTVDSCIRKLYNKLSPVIAINRSVGNIRAVLFAFVCEFKGSFVK